VVSLWPKARRQEQEARAAVPAADADGRLDGASA